MITYQLFEAGFCHHCERMTLINGHFKQRKYPSICALIKHKTKGYLLYDTGYTDRFNQLTQKFPQSLYRHLTPMTLKKSLKTQLLECGIQPTDINYIVISHFHADHIGGLHDFPDAQFICHWQAVHTMQHKSVLLGLLKGFLPGLLPNNFPERAILLKDNPIKLHENLSPFTEGFDLFGDQQLFAVPLPGHAKGHIGLHFKAEKDIFLIGDSCWHQEAFKELIYPSNLTYLIHDNKKAYIKTIQQLHSLYQNNKDIEIIPSHCEHISKKINGEQ